MKNNLFTLLALTFLSTLDPQLSTLFAQGTAFTYQGRLNDGGGPANGLNDLTFTLFTASSGGTTVGASNVVNDLNITNGLFSVTLDFGAGAFPGADRWLEVAVRPGASSGPYTSLVPRQKFTPSPYAITAGNLTGNGAGLTSVNAATLGGLAASSFWQIAGNAGTSPGANYLGASDSAQVRLHATGGFLMDNTTPSLSFGNQTRQMLNLWTTQYGIGVQNNTLYLRSEDNFSWFRRGSHDNNAGNAGAGGTNLMTLDFSGHLIVNSGVTVDSLALNNGSYYPGLVFGGGGETIASQRGTNGNNRYGIDFYTAFNPRLRIANNGNVGIGVTIPEHNLDVNGNLAVRGTLLVDSQNQNNGTDIPGIIFGDYNSFEVISSQRQTNGPNRYGIDFYTANNRRLSIANNGNIGIGTAVPLGKLDINTGVGTVQFRNDSGLVPGMNLTGGGLPGIMRFRNAIEIWPSDNAARAGYLDVRGTNGAANIQLNGANGEATVKVLTITGGADIAEPFLISGREIQKGAVVVIDEENPGRLKMSVDPYDTRVAGIVSGANGVNPGLALHQQGAIEGGQNVALSGRVYALADATDSPIKAGDLLTTSSTPGHIMKVIDRERGSGAILGKAMSTLKEGKGLVLVLVSLQ